MESGSRDEPSERWRSRQRGSPQDIPSVAAWLEGRKRAGATEPFDAGKLRAGIERSATGRLDDATVDHLVAGVEEELRATGGEVASDRVGMAVLERLRALDHVAYLRFASVYKGFEDLSDFEREVGELQKTTEPKPR